MEAEYETVSHLIRTLSKNGDICSAVNPSAGLSFLTSRQKAKRMDWSSFVRGFWDSSAEKAVRSRRWLCSSWMAVEGEVAEEGVVLGLVGDGLEVS